VESDQWHALRSEVGAGWRGRYARHL